MKLSSLWPNSQSDHPPAIGSLYQIGVTKRQYGMFRPIPVGEDGIVRIGHKRSPGRITAGDRHHVAITSSAFGDHQKILPMNLVQMRTFGPNPTGSPPDLL